MTAELASLSRPSAADFDDFYRSTAPSLLHHLHAFTGSQAEAQDCLQEAYARAWVRWDEVAHYDESGAWVRTVAVRHAISRFRRMKNNLLAHVRLGAPEPAPDLSPDALVLLDGLRQLPEVQRQALVLHYLVDLPVAEVAACVGAPAGTIKARLSRGRTALAAVMRPDPPTTERTSTPAERAARSGSAGPTPPTHLPGGSDV